MSSFESNISAHLPNKASNKNAQNNENEIFILTLCLIFFLVSVLFFYVTYVAMYLVKKATQTTSDDSSSNNSKESFDAYEPNRFSINSDDDQLRKDSLIIDHKLAIEKLNIKPSKSNLKISPYNSSTDVSMRVSNLEFDLKSSDSDAFCFDELNSTAICNRKSVKVSEMDSMRKSCISFKSVTFNEKKNTVKSFRKSIKRASLNF